MRWNLPGRNLFDVVIPSACVEREWELRDLIGDLVQMELRCFPSASPSPLASPRCYTNATARDLLRDYARLLSPGDVLTVNQADLVIEAQPPFWERLYKRIRQALGG